MSAPASMKIDIPGVDFAAMAKNAIAERLTEAMVGADAIVRQIVVAAMDRKVDDKGQINNYSHCNTTPFIEWLAHDLIRRAALEVLAKRVEALKPQLEKAIEAELKRSTKVAAKALTESFVKRAADAYGISCDIALKVRASDE